MRSGIERHVAVLGGGPAFFMKLPPGVLGGQVTAALLGGRGVGIRICLPIRRTSGCGDDRFPYFIASKPVEIVNVACLLHVYRSTRVAASSNNHFTLVWDGKHV
jgi:hypothetical protein